MNGEQMFSRLCQVEEALVKNTRHLGADACFDPLTPFWKEEFRKFLVGEYERGIWRVGRQGQKSSSCSMLGVTIALYEEVKLAPGVPAVVAIVSVRMNDAIDRLRYIMRILDTLKVPYKKDGT